MAEAKHITVSVPAVTLETRVSLELTKGEAQFLADILANGVCGAGRRATSDNIYRALHDIGIRYANTPDFTGRLKFSEQV